MGLQAKNRRYATTAKGWQFRPFGLETSGGLGPAATQVCKRLARAIAMKLGCAYGETASSLQQALHLALAKGRAEMLVACRPRAQ